MTLITAVSVPATRDAPATRARYAPARRLADILRGGDQREQRLDVVERPPTTTSDPTATPVEFRVMVGLPQAVNAVHDGMRALLAAAR